MVAVKRRTWGRGYHFCDGCDQPGKCLIPMDGKEYCAPCWRARGGPARDEELRRRIVEEFPVQGKLF